MNNFVSADFKISKNLKTERICLEPLTVDHLDLDYDAVISSLEHLKGVFGPYDEWPDPNISRDQDLKDLRFHQEEFERGSSFTYAVLSLDKSKCLGCVYIIPSKHPDYEAVVILWVRQDEIENGLDGHVFETVKKWLGEKWPFKKVAFPGREQDWSEFPYKLWDAILKI